MTRRNDYILTFYNDNVKLSTEIAIGPSEFLLLMHIAYKDIFSVSPTWAISDFDSQSDDYYSITHDIIQSLPTFEVADVVDILRRACQGDIASPFLLYLKNLCSLHKRRFKYLRILSCQAFASPDVIAPRALLEYGFCPNSLLFTWLQWRKWMYDIDNRSAQETGYLFEPILAACLGGIPVSHQKSPVKRLSGDYGGRQLDCYVQDTKEVYELKMRVSIAASGQGRFSEELSFPREAKAAGLKPILVVFDGSNSSRLEELKHEYETYGGIAKIGDEAWALLDEKAGPEMAKFLNKYIKPIIENVTDLITDMPASIGINVTRNKLVFTSSASADSYTINRITDTPDTN